MITESPVIDHPIMPNSGRAMQVLLYACILIMLGLPGEGTICESGRGYPVECPRVGDPQDRTKCCKDYRMPSCCDDRATHICARSGSSERSGGGEPSAAEAAIFCPMPGDPDDYTACCTSGSTMSCCSSNILVGALCGAFGLFVLICIIILIVCCVLVKKKILVCVKTRQGKWTPGKWTMMTAANAERFETMRQQLAPTQYTGQQQNGPNITAAPTENGHDNIGYSPPLYNEAASAQDWAPEKDKTPL